jgi:hypothetical protein
MANNTPDSSITNHFSMREPWQQLFALMYVKES